MAFSRRSATLEPDSRRAIRRSTIGASTRPTTAQSRARRRVSRCRQESPNSTAAIEPGSSAERMPRPSQ